MYIRRKVFSIAEDMYGDERYFSTTDIDLGFSDYDDNFYDERLYAEDEGLSTGAKIGLGVAGTAATTAGALYAAKKGWLGNRAKGWYESGASKLKNMFSKEAKNEVTEAANKVKGRKNNQNRRLNKNTKVDPNAKDNSLVSNYSDLTRSGDAAKISEFRKNFDIEKTAAKVDLDNLLKRPGMEGSAEVKAARERLKRLTDVETRLNGVDKARIERAQTGALKTGTNLGKDLRLASAEEHAAARKEYMKYLKTLEEKKKHGIEENKMGINEWIEAYGKRHGVRYFSNRLFSRLR